MVRVRARVRVTLTLTQASRGLLCTCVVVYWYRAYEGCWDQGVGTLWAMEGSRQ